MANWCKLFETDLDESRMRFAVNKLPEVWPVWTAILIECCKASSDTIRWSETEQELFGFSDRLKISLGKINLAVSILCEIGYAEKSNGTLKVLVWNEKQNDYLRRKSQGYWKNHRDSRIVTVNHSEARTLSSPISPESSQGDCKGGDSLATAEHDAELPTKEQAIAMTMTSMIPEEFAGYVYDDWSSRGGKDASQCPVPWVRYAKKRWEREKMDWINGTHKGLQKTAPTNGTDWKGWGKTACH